LKLVADAGTDGIGRGANAIDDEEVDVEEDVGGEDEVDDDDDVVVRDNVRGAASSIVLQLLQVFGQLVRTCCTRSQNVKSMLHEFASGTEVHSGSGPAASSLQSEHKIGHNALIVAPDVEWSHML
jgi:hypothetical protein